MDNHEVIISWLQIGIAAAAFFISGLAAVIRVTWVVRGLREEMREEYKKAIAEHIEEENEKRAATWRRFDEYKSMCEAKFVSKEICSVMHTDTARNVGKLEAKIDGFIIRMEAKIDELFKTLIDDKTQRSKP